METEAFGVEDTSGTIEKVRRWEVTVEHQVIVYAADSDTAGTRAMQVVNGQATRPLKVVEVKELPNLEDEPMPEIVEGPSGRPPAKK